MERYINIGRIVKAHGIAGELKCKLLYKLIDAGKIPPNIFLNRNDTELPYFIAALKETNFPDFIIKFEDVNNRALAESLKNLTLSILEEDFSKYFISEDHSNDITGYFVVSKKGMTIGQIEEVLDLPAHTTLSVIKDGKEILLPFVDEFVSSINHYEKKVIYDAPDGLLELFEK